MSPIPNRKTVRLSFESKERAIAILRSLIRSGYFGDELPSEVDLSRQLRIPRSSIFVATEKLKEEGLVDGTRITAWHQRPPVGQVAFVVNNDVLDGWASVFQDWFIGFEQTMAEEGYETELLAGFKSHLEKIEKIQAARDRGAMAVAFASHTEERILHYVLEHSIPVVVVGNASTHFEECGTVCTDNRSGIEKIIPYLLEQGHRSIACYVSGLNFHDSFKERYQFYQNVMRSKGLEPISSLAFGEPHHPLMARRAAETLRTLPNKPTAVFCGSDRDAFEIIAELKHLNINVPKDISVAAFDNNHYAQVLDPPLTTVDIHGVHMGRVAANYLLNEMQVPQLPVKILLPTELIIRTSVSPRQVEDEISKQLPAQEGSPSGILTY